ncbi:MAG: aminoglycoside 6'-N-acetyltransferase [Cyclobacteriaceae bacterium]
MNVEILSHKNLESLLNMVVKMWPDCNRQEEHKYYLNAIDSKKEIVFLAEVSDQHIAFAHATLRTDYVEGTSTNPVAYLEAIYVEPEYRRLNVAKQLIDEVEKWGLRMGCTELGSDVEINNMQSENLHKKVGFKEANRVICFAKKLEENG